MRASLLLLPFLLLTACTPSKEKFARQSAELTCEKLDECLGSEALTLLGYTDVDDCKQQAGDEAEESAADDEECTDYDGKAASSCLKDLEATSCDDLMNGVFPDSCMDVCPSSSDDGGSDTATLE
jgi:hypothetical protein